MWMSKERKWKSCDDEQWENGRNVKARSGTNNCEIATSKPAERNMNAAHFRLQFFSVDVRLASAL